MKLPSIAILDLIGLVYDGSTLSKKGLGGSESAVILMAKELANLGFPVTVFNACREDDARPGIYDGVEYRPIDSIGNIPNLSYDIMIASRTVVPFVPEHYYEAYKTATRHHPRMFEFMRKSAKLKVLWMHDTFCNGDNNVEDLVVNGYIDKIFTLSDFHTAYVTNCHHGRRRNFEVLKNKMFITRNGVVNYKPEVDISLKDRNLFVYNASVTKGMLPLIDKIWPSIKAAIPEAKLKVIGGYYKFRSEAPLDEQGKTLHKLAADPKYKQLDIEFTGIISQKEIAEILSKANMFLFPGAFPETFGISTLESLTYNTPLVATRFGALEETAVDQACYFIDYAIEPNSLFGDINTEDQCRKFTQTVLQAYNNWYLHQQKQYYCNIVKDINTWDTVALQWKQYFLAVFNQYMSADEYRKVSYINDRIHTVFGRRFSNPIEWNSYKRNKELPIAVITPFYNAEKYITRCIESIITQDYDDYTLYLIDDNSNDESQHIVNNYIKSLPLDIKCKIVRTINKENKGAVYNQITALRKHEFTDDTIIMFIDGDDALVNDNNIFNFYNNLYHDNKTDFSYGSSWSEVDNIPLISQPYPSEVKQSKSYRNHIFNWGMPYTHLRTFRYGIFKKIENDDCFKDENGKWWQAGGDNATFYNIIEQADPDKVRVVQDIVYLYNDKNPLNDYKIHGEQQNANASKIKNGRPSPIVVNVTEDDRAKSNLMDVPAVMIEQGEHSKRPFDLPKKQILIAIPTAKNIEPTTFKSIYDLIIPEGYEANFQYFYGYNVDQVRNLIADWVVKGYDYLFSVDYDISFPPDTLVRLLAHDKDVVSGVYRQRFYDHQTLELFENNDRGGYTHIPWQKIKGKGLVEVGACGFGCVLVKKEVMVKIGYPQFLYKSALDHSHTFSEDLFFARRAQQEGFKLYADTSILCDHTGSFVFKVEDR
jgi:glycosyltransferase involved in cell wall biosynthesis